MIFKRKPELIVTEDSILLFQNGRVYGFYGESFIEIPVLSKEEYQAVLAKEQANAEKKPT